MTTTLSLDLTYDAPLDAVTAMLTDPAFREQVATAQHSVSTTIAITGIPGVVTIDSVQETRGVPAFAQRFVGGRVKVAQREEWTTPTTARLHVDPGTSAARIDGTLQLTETAGRTVKKITLTVEVKVPLVGGKLEGLIADLTKKAFAKDELIARTWLAN